MTKEQKFDENGNRVICAKDDCDNKVEPGKRVCSECSARVDYLASLNENDPEEKAIINFRC